MVDIWEVQQSIKIDGEVNSPNHETFIHVDASYQTSNTIESRTKSDDKACIFLYIQA